MTMINNINDKDSRCQNFGALEKFCSTYMQYIFRKTSFLTYRSNNTQLNSCNTTKYGIGSPRRLEKKL